MPDGDAWGACSLARTSTPGLTSIRRQTSQICICICICICIFNYIVLFINMCICIWSKQLYIYPQTGKQPCKDVHSRSSSILGQTSPNQLEFQTGLAFNLLPASAFSVQFVLDFEKIILENIQQSKKNEKRTEIKILGEFLKKTL